MGCSVAVVGSGGEADDDVVVMYVSDYCMGDDSWCWVFGYCGCGYDYADVSYASGEVVSSSGVSSGC